MTGARLGCCRAAAKDGSHRPEPARPEEGILVRNGARSAGYESKRRASPLVYQRPGSPRLSMLILDAPAGGDASEAPRCPTAEGRSAALANGFAPRPSAHQPVSHHEVAEHDTQLLISRMHRLTTRLIRVELRHYQAIVLVAGELVL